MWHVNRESFVHRILVTPFLSFWIMSQYILLAKATNYWQTKSYYNQGGIKIQRWGTQMYFLCTVPGIRSIPRSSCSNQKSLCLFCFPTSSQPRQQSHTLISPHQSSHVWVNDLQCLLPTVQRYAGRRAACSRACSESWERWEVLLEMDSSNYTKSSWQLLITSDRIFISEWPANEEKEKLWRCIWTQRLFVPFIH